MNRGNIRATTSYAGGLCGYLISETDSQGVDINNSGNEGNIVASSYTGGIMGYIEGNGHDYWISQAFNNGKVQSLAGYAGGIVGYMSVNFSTSWYSNLYNTGQVTASHSAGGIAGYGSTGTLGFVQLNCCYNWGNISAYGNCAALVGRASIGGWTDTEAIRVYNSYYMNTVTSNDSSVVQGNCVALDEDQFKDQQSFAAFDFENVWMMDEAYPVFLWQASRQKCGENAYWWVYGPKDDQTLVISGFGNTYDFELSSNTPWHYDYHIKHAVVGDKVTGLGNNIFFAESQLESVSLGKAVESIGDSAFFGCTELKEIVIPASVQKVSDMPFTRSGIKTITFEGDAPAFSNAAFYNFPVTVIYDSDFDGWENAIDTFHKEDIKWIDKNGLFVTNHISYQYSDDKQVPVFGITIPLSLMNKLRVGIPSKKDSEYEEELYSWVQEFGYEDIISKSDCKKS